MANIATSVDAADDASLPRSFADAPAEILHTIFLECILAEFLPVEGGIAEEELFEMAESDWADSSSVGTNDSADLDSVSETDEVTQEELASLRNEEREPLPSGYHYAKPSRSHMSLDSIPPNRIARLKYANTRAPWLLGQICRWWRVTVMSSPSLWRYIDVNVDDYMFGQFDSSVLLLQHHLELSGNQTLHIRFTAYLNSGRAYQLFELLFIHQQQWETLELAVPDETLVPLLEYVDLAIPDTGSQEDLQISDGIPSFSSLISVILHNHGELPQAQSRIPFFGTFFKSPNMQIFHSVRPFPISTLPLHWEHLLSLSLYLLSPVFAIPLLQHFHTLKQCTFEFPYHYGPFEAEETLRVEDMQKLHLPLLHSLTLHLGTSVCEEFVMLMTCIDTPNLEQFAYHISSDRGRSLAATDEQRYSVDTGFPGSWAHEMAVRKFLENCGQNLRAVFIDCKITFGEQAYLTHQDLFQSAPLLEHATFASQALNFVSMPLPPLRTLDLLLPSMAAADLFDVVDGNGVNLEGISCQFIVNSSDELSNDDFVIKADRLRNKQIDLDIWEGPLYLIPNLRGITYPPTIPNSGYRLLQKYIEHRALDYRNRLKNIHYPQSD